MTVLAGKTGHHPHPGTAPTDATVIAMAGDGIGPEVMAATRHVLDAVRAPIDVIDSGVDRSTGLPEREAIDLLDGGALLLKAPMSTPVGGGHKSPNVTLRKILELYANVRPARTLPGIASPVGHVDLVIVRENIEDLYAGVEHAQTADVYQCLKLISRSGSEAIARVAFDLAAALGRSQLTCVTKANIMKVTDGVFLDAFRREAALRDHEPDHVLVDAAACQLVTNPSRFDVIVTTNLYGDILSDLAAGLTGGLGLAPSMNLGARCASFEPVHGSAPDIAGQDAANPTAMILSAALLLQHLGDHVGAGAIRAAIDEVYAARSIRTRDLPCDGARIVGCDEFGRTVAELAAARRQAAGDSGPTTTTTTFTTAADPRPAAAHTPIRREVGADVFVEWSGEVEELASSLQQAAADLPLELAMITNRGLSVWPAPTRARLVDHFRCRFVTTQPHDEVDENVLLTLLERVGRHARWMHVERLQQHDGEAAYSAAYGAG